MIRRWPLIPSILVAAAIATMIGLGVWQLQRRGEKLDLLASLAVAQDQPAIDVADGPAAFLILIVGTIVAVAAIVVDLAYSPAWWVHLIWLPVMIAVTLAGLRFGKAALIYQIYHHQAGEGRLSK